MIKKDTSILYIYLAGLSIVFIIISIMVILTKENPYFIKKKLKIGAVIITLTGMISSFQCQWNDSEKKGGQPVCYAPLPSNDIMITSSNDLCDSDLTGSEICIDLTEHDSLSGTIQFYDGTGFSFLIIDESGNVIQQENIITQDGILDEDSEDFEIIINDSIETGTYILAFFSTDIEEQSEIYMEDQYTINIINEN